MSGSKIAGRFYIGEDAYMRRSEACESVISKGCTIDDSHISGTLLMKNCRVDGARIERSVIGEGCIIGGNAFITSSVPPHTRVSMRAPELQFKPDGFAETDKPEYWCYEI